MEVYSQNKEQRIEPTDARHNLLRVAELVHGEDSPFHPSGSAQGNLIWKFNDILITALRNYLPPLHWLLVGITSLVLFLYIHITAATSSLIIDGAMKWPDFPAPGILSIWHESAPALLVAAIKRRPRAKIVVMVSPTARGDHVATLFRMLGFRIVRGEIGISGWFALNQLCAAVGDGSIALITVDGGGPRRTAKVGAIALAASTGTPLIPAGLRCQPAIVQRGKWDRTRIPLPFARVCVVIEKAITLSVPSSKEAVEKDLSQLQKALEFVDALATSRSKKPNQSPLE